LKRYSPAAKAAVAKLENGTGAGNDFLGWLHLPSSINKAALDDIEASGNTPPQEL
jgi:glucose-6-phosphate isomerase